MLAFSLASAVNAQSPVPLAGQTLAALDPGTALHSIRLTGTVTRHLGAPVTGTVTLEAAGPARSRVEFDFPDGNRMELRGDDSHGRPWGTWSGADGTAHAMALANCWIPAAWFLPQLAVLVPGHADEMLAALADARGLHRLQRVRQLPHQPPQAAAEIQRLSTAVLGITPATGLPATLDFLQHPDDGGPAAVPVEIRYGDYRSVAGIQIPFHIQEYMQRALVYDIEIANAEVNPSIDASDFTEPAAVADAYDKPHQPQGAAR